MVEKSELSGLVGKKCWFADGVLEIRQHSDAEIVSVTGDDVVLQHFLGKRHEIPLSSIQTIRRND